jgi:hypothetical protein
MFYYPLLTLLMTQELVRTYWAKTDKLLINWNVKNINKFWL